MLNRDTTALVVIDVQGKLAQIMHDRDRLFKSLQQMVKGAQALDLPILWLEQNPQGLGRSIDELLELLDSETPIEKTSFSCCGSEEFVKALEATGCKQVLLTGIETHICVYQTAADLIARGYDVEVVADAVSSRTSDNKAIGLQKIRDYGGQVTCVETALFEMLKHAKAPEFKAILKAIK